MDTFLMPWRPLSALLFVAPKNDLRQRLNGVYLDGEGYAVATDGSILAAIKLPDAPSFDLTLGIDPILPTELLAEADKFITDKQRDAQVEIGFDTPNLEDISIELKFAGRTLTATAPRLKYPPWRQVMPTTERAHSGEIAQFDPHLLVRLNKCVSRLAAAKNDSQVAIEVWHRGKKAGAYVTANDKALPFDGVAMPYEFKE